MVLEQLDVHNQKRKERMQAQTLHFAQKLTQNGSQVDPNVICKNIKFLHDIRRENLDHLGYGDDFWNLRPKACSMKERIDNIKKIQFCERQCQGIKRRATY